jgi:hypothetical protein
MTNPQRPPQWLINIHCNSCRCLLPVFRPRAPSHAQSLKRDGGGQCESDRASSHLDPDGERVTTKLLGGEALGTCDFAWNRHWYHSTASIANCGEGDGSNGAAAGRKAEFWRASISSHAGGEYGGNVIMLQGDDWPFHPILVSKRAVAGILHRLTI